MIPLSPPIIKFEMVSSFTMKFLSFGLFLTACTNINGYSGKDYFDSGSSEEEDIEEVDVQLEISEAFRVPERSWDLALHPDGRIFCSTQSGSKVYSWDPQTGSRSEEIPNYADIQALSIPNEDEVFYTTTEYGVTGTLSVMIDNAPEVLATQADDGTLIRWPTDLIQADDGGWLMADYEDASVFWVHSDGSTSHHSVGSSYPEALFYQEPYLYIGGEDGLFQMEWPNGEPEQISERPTFGLEAVHDQIWASTISGVYSLDGSFGNLSEVARGGSLVFSNNVLYLGDKVGEGVWQISF